MIERILILDFGSQYTQLIARRIREQNVYCEIWSYTAEVDVIKEWGPKGLILSGGPDSVLNQDSPRVATAIYNELNIPIFAICYGMQLIMHEFQGSILQDHRREYGRVALRKASKAEEAVQQMKGSTAATTAGIMESELLRDCFGSDNELVVWMSHGDRVAELPPTKDANIDGEWVVTASTPSCPYAAVENRTKRIYCVQFHPEVTHTVNGTQIYKNFLYKICGLTGTWTASNFINETISEMRKKIGSASVVLGVSGGVDSSVTAALLSLTIGKQLHCVFVDNGLLRLHEDETVPTILRECGVKNLIVVSAADTFLSRLEGVTCPENKRKIIGQTFVEIFDEQSSLLEGVEYLAQGTIYPDVIESSSDFKNHSVCIKSHHNVGGLPAGMKLKLCEPIRNLFKDEVRKVGFALGMPSEHLMKHPFPGPGLAVRVLGAVSKAQCDTLRLADAIFMEELRSSGWYEKCSQAFAVFLPVNSVGVVGDSRQYAPVIALRAVETEDFMTAKWARLPYEVLERCSSRIVNEVRGISRVVYDINGKPPATIEWE